jgi:GntR family transcriptional regulator of abcA and norABC
VKQSKYKQVMNLITAKITGGEWTIGSQIPSQRELAKLFQVNRSTIITATEELKADGLLVSHVGKGTIVANNTWSLMKVDKPINWSGNITLGMHKESMKTVKMINELEAKNELIQLGKSELSPDLFPKEAFQNIVQNVSSTLYSLGYEEPKGNLKLRETICHQLKSKGIQASPSSVLIVSGALQALQLISIGLLNKGSTVYVERPSYVLSLSIFQSGGMKLETIPADLEGPIPKGMKDLHNSKAYSALYTIPTFHNPTGYVISERRREQLMQLCEDEQIPIIEDDVYGDLWIDDKPPKPLKASDTYGNVLYVGSLSKTLAPGLRIGWVVGPESVIDRLADLKMQTDYGSSSLSQHVAAEWLKSENYELHLAKVREELKIRRNIALNALSKHLSSAAEWNVPKGGFFIWLKVLPPIQNKHLFEKALSAGILINPGNIYDKHSTQYIRLSYGFAAYEEIEAGIRRLGEMLKNI